MAFFGYRNAEGKPLTAKIVADLYFVATMCVSFLPVFFLPGHMGAIDRLLGPLGAVVLAVLDWSLYLSPFVYLFMPKGRERIIRFCVSFSCCVLWFFLTLPCV